MDVATEQMPSPKIRRTSPEAAEESTPPATSLSNTQIEFFSLKSSPVVGALQQVAPMISKIGRMIGIVESPRILHPAASRGEGITTPPVSCTHTPKLVRVHHEKCEENEVCEKLISQLWGMSELTEIPHCVQKILTIF